MTVYGRSRNPGPVDVGVLGFNPLAALSWRAAFWASDPAWATRPAEGAGVASWRNGGSFASSATQGTGNAQPVWSASSFAGKPGVTFDGTDDFLSLASVTGLNSTTLSVVSVFKMTSVSGTKITSGLSGVENRYTPAVISGAWYGRLRNGAGSTYITGGTADTNAHLFTLIGRPTGTTLDMRFDGASVASSSSSDAVPDVPSPQTLYLGSDGGGGRGPMVLAFYGVYVGDVETDANWGSFRAQMKAFYGLP